MFRKFLVVLAFLILPALLASCGGADGNDEMDARIMSIFRVDGDGV